MDLNLFPFKRSTILWSKCSCIGLRSSLKQMTGVQHFLFSISGTLTDVQSKLCHVSHKSSLLHVQTLLLHPSVLAKLLFIVATYLKCPWIECNCNTKLSFLTTMLKSLERVHKDSQWIVPWQMEVKLLSTLGWRRSKNLGRILHSGFVTHDLEFWSSRKKIKISNWLQYAGVLL